MVAACPAASGPVPEDFRGLYQAELSFVWRTLRRYGVRGAALDDGVQEVFTIVHTKLGSFEGRSSLRTWIFGIARRVARDHRPEARQEPHDPALLELVPEIDERGPVASVERREETRLLYELLAELVPERREVFVLVELEQMTVPEAAEALGENVNTVKARLRAARAQLEELLARRAAHQEWRKQCATRPQT
jgi:RNA polymerase sigma-70 factor, ECF subfamily